MDAYLSEIPSETLQHACFCVASSPIGTGIPLFDDQLRLNRGDVVEIQGSSSCGKTHLLYHLLLAGMLPPTESTIPSWLAGRGMSAIVFDTDNSFDILRFRHLLTSRISHLFPQLDERKHTEIMQVLLARLHMFRPKSLLQVATSLKYLPSYHASRMPDSEIGILAIDSMSTFYWSDRFHEEQLHNFSPEKARNRIEPLHHVLTAISDLIHSHGPAVILTNWGLHTTSQDHPSCGPTALYKQHLRRFPAIHNAPSCANAAASNTNQFPLPCPLRLAHHISLFRLTTTSISPTTGPDQNFQRQKGVIRDTHELMGLISSSRAQAVGRFTLLIDGDAVLIRSPPTAT
ncbi:hypothetical protein ID866_1749 [Astraeus odoratus]|nr:hypothetical protein ID866_1749 [Astraeus odoratus]